MLIDKPGYYTSKAGKCEVVAIMGNWAIGWNLYGQPRTWRTDGPIVSGATISKEDDESITGPWVEPRKPIEAWAVVYPTGTVNLFSVKDTAEAAMGAWNAARLVHLREVEGNR